MFRVFLSSTRAAQRNSQTALRYTRSFNYTPILVADGAQHIKSPSISPNESKDGSLTSAITGVDLVANSVNLVADSTEGITSVPLSDAASNASNDKPTKQLLELSAEARATIKKGLAEKRAKALHLPKGDGLGLSEENRSLLFYLTREERRQRASAIFDSVGRLRAKFKYLQQFHDAILNETAASKRYRPTKPTKSKRQVTREEKAAKRAKALELPMGDGLNLSEDDKLLLFYLTMKEKHQRASGVFDMRGRIYAPFEYLRKIHYASIGRHYKEPEEKTRGRPTELQTSLTSVDTARGSKRTPKPLFPSGPEQAESIVKWETVIDYLMAEFGRKRKNKGDVKRMNIVGESLCDDIIERLKPTLQKHKGCDIVDINPGVGIWSSKIHDLLKPRTHILLEPDKLLYEPFLKPLLDAPNSTYTLVPKSGIVWGHLEKVMSQEYLPFQKPFDKGDPRLEQPNNTILLIANLGHYPKKSFAGFQSLAALVLYQFLSSMQTHSLIQRYGLVKMLIWVPDDERNAVIPRSLSWRRKSSIDAAISCENIVEVASSTRALRNSPRERHLEADIARKVLRKMEDAGLKTPPGRESLLVEELSREKQDHNLKQADAQNSKYRKELTELAATVDSMDPAEAAAASKRMRFLEHMLKFLERRAVKHLGLCDDFDAIMELQKEIYNSNDEASIAILKEELDQRTNDWKETFANLPDEYHMTIQQMVDNRIAVSTHPPTLLYDRREYEPLRVHPGDFYPAKEMCLLDFQPMPLWPVLRDNLQENLEIYSFIVGLLFIIPTQSIRRGFNALAPGAFEYLIAECSSITNPNKGGSLDLDLMTVRRLTEEMLKEMVEAWVRWPFKPTRYELLARSGGSIHDPDEMETDGSDMAD